MKYPNMATLSYSLSRKADKATNKHEILARFVVGSRINQRAKTGVFAPADYWNADGQAVKVPGWRLMNAEQRKLVETLNDINARLQGIKAAVMDSFIQAGAGKQPLPAGWLASTIDRYNNPEQYEEKPKTLYLSDGFEDYLQYNKISNQRDKNTRVVLRSLLRYEALTGSRLELDTLTADDIRAFEGYIRQEGGIVEKHPELLKVCPESRAIESRSENTVIGRLKILRAVVLWNVANGHTDNNPFARYSIGECVYGTPYYITIQERERLFRVDLSSQPQLAIQRDIFVFQCLVGCRVSDLLKLTRSNLIDGGIFVSAQKYNQAIKRIFLAAGLTRPVTVLDPLTRQEVQRPLNEIASSHLARRTFVGNLYKQVKDPNLISKLSGHTEGSRAFARYRDIDEEMRKDLVNLLEDGE